MELFGMPLKKYTPEALSNHVAFVFQNAEEMFIDDSVRKEIEFYLKARKVENMTFLVDQILEDFDLTGLTASRCSFIKWWATTSCIISDWCCYATIDYYS